MNIVEFADGRPKFLTCQTVDTLVHLYNARTPLPEDTESWPGSKMSRAAQIVRQTWAKIVQCVAILIVGHD